jgi:hypothetical protein
MKKPGKRLPGMAGDVKRFCKKGTVPKPGPLLNHLLFWAPLKADLDPSRDDEGQGTQVLKVLQTKIARKGAALDVQSQAWSEPENAAQRELGIMDPGSWIITIPLSDSALNMGESSQEVVKDLSKRCQ